MLFRNVTVDWPYAAAVERKGWASTASGLNAGSAGAAFSLEDGQTELTTTTDPSTALNNDSPSGMLDVRCIGAGTSSIPYAYGTITGTNIATAGGTFAKELDKDSLYSDDFEVDTMGTVWTGTTANEVSSCTSATGHGGWIWSADRAHSGSRSYHTPEQATDICYENPEESLVSPNLTIPAGVGLRELRFWHAADIPCPGYTRGRVWVSTDGGSTWTRIDGFYKDAGDLSWEETAINLGAYSEAGQLRFKLVMYTYECWSGCSATEGWYIDDVRVLIDEKDGCS